MNSWLLDTVNRKYCWQTHPLVIGVCVCQLTSQMLHRITLLSTKSGPSPPSAEASCS